MKNIETGAFVCQGCYMSFRPTELRQLWTVDNADVMLLLSEADRHVGRLDMYSELVDIDMFISMYVAKEVTRSSKIEGIQVNTEEVFLSEPDIANEKRGDWEEVQNYIAAVNETAEMLDTLPFSSRLIKQANKILLQGVRGEYKQPGEFRRSQNWIGSAKISDAVFIPPIHTQIEHFMSDLEKYANEYNDVPDLIKAALIHYQFETIHPFLDGNGRVGRLLITLYLMSKGILKQPVLYLSDFFERNKMLYYDSLMQVRTQRDVNQWLRFFLTGVTETAKSGVDTLDEILKLQHSVNVRIDSFGKRSDDARLVVDFLYRNPIISVREIAELTNKTRQTAYKLISDFEDAKILEKITGAQRNRLYVFKEYVDLF